MSSNKEMPATIRQGTPEDVEPILNLLTEYELPRSYFEPFYLNDSSYRPEQSWVVEQHGRLLSHLRIYDRWIRVGQAKMHIAGIGNVITAQDARGQGYSGQIMRAMLPVLQLEGYAYSLLWTHIPQLYARYGWAPIEQDLVRAVLPVDVENSARIAPLQASDLPAVMRLYEAANAERTGTAIRTPEYWREQSTWLQETPEHLMEQAVEILELAVEGGSFDIGRELLAAISMQRGGQLQGQFPPSLRAVFLPGEANTLPESGLMGRAINLAELLRVLEPLWRERLRAASGCEGALILSTSAGRAEVRIQNEEIQVSELPAAQTPEATPSLDEGAFAHLLFHGCDERAGRIDVVGIPCLRVLFPEQDFVIWSADAF
ncbi:MAG: GNAT family N-acetyltransferase [Chloroflexi bacterium]|nr:MAG: GNAT family N-acetyltransferase [Chloroflexota bacterium]